MQRVDLTVEMTHALETLSKSSRSPLSITLLAALKVLLSRYSRTVVVDVVNTPRSDAELAMLMGPVLGALPIRTDSVSRMTFRELLARVRDSTLDALDDPLPDVCLPGLVADRRFDRVVFDFMPEDQSADHLFAGIQTSASELEWFRGRWYDYDLFCLAQVARQRLCVRMIVSSALFDSANDADFASQLAQILEAVVRTPDIPVSRLLNRIAQA
jgi:non-ribosomal peptide synthetase component F